MRIRVTPYKNPTARSLVSCETKEQIPSWSMHQQNQFHPPNPATHPDSPEWVAYPRYSRDGRSEALTHRLFCGGRRQGSAVSTVKHLPPQQQYRAGLLHCHNTNVSVGKLSPALEQRHWTLFPKHMESFPMYSFQVQGFLSSH